MPKLKQMPNTKSQGKFLGPFTVSRITDSHAIISKEELNSKRDKKVPIHITLLYYERQEMIVDSTINFLTLVIKIYGKEERSDI